VSFMACTATDVLRVAVADDEPIMQMYLEETVALLGHEVVAVAKDGADLVHKCELSRPHLIVTDIRMPGCDGYQAVQRICNRYVLPVVFVTGFDESSRLEQAESFCVANYLTKPVDEAQLQEGIATVLARYRRFRLLREEAADDRDALQRLRRVQQALVLLWKREGLPETEAFERLTERAELEHRSVSEVAESILHI
jgi:AmiR/NasT family two-component response regulator